LVGSSASMGVPFKPGFLAFVLLAAFSARAGAVELVQAQKLPAPIDDAEVTKAVKKDPLMSWKLEGQPNVKWNIDKVVPFSSLGSQAKKYLIVLKSEGTAFVVGIFSVGKKHLVLDRLLRLRMDWFSELLLVPAGPAGKLGVLIYTNGGS